MALNAKILVLEDEPLIRLLLTSKLEEAGNIVDGAECCTQALSLIRSAVFDAAVFDYRLPDGNSIDVVRTMRAEAISVPVLILSGESTYIDSELCSELGISSVLPKPVDVDEVCHALSSALDSKPVDNSVCRVGAYLLCHPTALCNVPESQKLAIDVSETNEADLLVELKDILLEAPAGTTLVGARYEAKEMLLSLNPDLCFVKDVDELAAISRRRSSPDERAALMQSVVRSL